MPSILSNKPPCPGIIIPVSLIFDALLKDEIKISPNWLVPETTKVNITKLITGALLKKLKTKFKGMMMKDRKKLPNSPEYVLFGL